MLIQSEFDIQFHLPAPLTMVAMLNVHPTVFPLLRKPDVLTIEHITQDAKTVLGAQHYTDSFGNCCARFSSPEGTLRLSGSHVVEMADEPEALDMNAEPHLIANLPSDTIQFLLNSRYCQVDLLSHIARDLFGATTAGMPCAIAIRDWVHDHLRFDYASARPTKTALDVYSERVGVCRDFQHLAIALTRAMNIPARYVTGQLGDIRIPYSGPGDFSAWYEVYLGNRWWTMDARHNVPRVGRILMAAGRDATDVAITTSFGVADLKHFYVESNEVNADGTRVPLPPGPTGAASGLHIVPSQTSAA
jgi:transglutaminase-like putative cysteine protease